MKFNLIWHRVLTAMRSTTMFLVGLGFFSQALLAGSQTGADFLKIPIGAEPAGLGQAYTALAHDLNALNWNPAGISRPPNQTRRTAGISLSHQDEFSEDNLDHIGLIIPGGVGSRNTWGLDMIRLSYGNQEGRAEDRSTTGNFSASDMAVGAAYARNFGMMQVGTQLKFIRQELANEQANGFAVDLGLLSATPWKRLSMGMSARNLGPSMQYVRDSYNLPLTVSFGTAYRLASPIILACDVHYKPYQHQTVLAIGSQLMPTANLSFRAGYLAKLAEAVTNDQKSESDKSDFVGVNGLAGGIGFSFRQFNLDYSITPFGELGNTQMLTLSTWFGDKQVEEKRTKTSDTNATPDKSADDQNMLKLPESDDSWWDKLSPK